MKRIGGVDTEVVALDNIGSSLTNDLTGIVVAQGDQLFFRFDTCGDPGGDISRADIHIKGTPLAAARSDGSPAFRRHHRGGKRLHLQRPGDWRENIPMAQEWQSHSRRDECQLPNPRREDDRRRHLLRRHRLRAQRQRRAERHAEETPCRKGIRPRRRRQVFSQTLAEQEKELKTNELMLRFAASRKKLAADPYRPAYHFVSPESQMNDPNGLCFWQGRWHLFYQALSARRVPRSGGHPETLLQHWGHAVSDDLVHWRDLPYAIYPGIETDVLFRRHGGRGEPGRRVLSGH